jgi:Flp pilus assembly protein TadB
MSFTTHPVLFAVGLGLVVVAVLLWRLASRWDLKGQAIDSAVRSAWNRRVVISDELSDRYRDVRDAPTHMSRAGRVAGHAARHFAAQVLTVGSWVTLAAGLALTVLAVVWK